MRANFWQFSNWFEFLLLEIDGHPNKGLQLCKPAPLSCLPVHSIVRRIFEHVQLCRRKTLQFSREASPTPVIFSCTSRNTWFTHYLKLFNNCFSRFAFSLWVHPKYTWSRNDVRSPTSTFFINFFHMGAIFCFIPAILMSSTCTDENKPLFPMNEHTFPVRKSLPCSNKAPVLSASPMAILVMDHRTNFVKRYPALLNFIPLFWPFVSWKAHPNIWTFRWGNFEQFGSILQFYLGISRYCVSCLSIATW